MTNSASNGMKKFLEGLSTLRPRMDAMTTRVYLEALRKWHMTDAQWTRAWELLRDAEEYRPELPNVYPYLKQAQAAEAAQAVLMFTMPDGRRYAQFFNLPATPQAPGEATDVRIHVLNPDCRYERSA